MLQCFKIYTWDWDIVKLWVAKYFIFKIAFRIRSGYYKFLIMPCGMTNTLVVIMTLWTGLSTVFESVVIVLFDDAFIYLSSKKILERHFEIALQKFREN